LDIHINEALTNIQEWTSANKLSESKGILGFDHTPKKTKFIHKLHIKFDDTPILIQEHVTYLGILIDTRLTFIQNIQHLEKNMSFNGNYIQVKEYYIDQIIIYTLC